MRHNTFFAQIVTMMLLVTTVYGQISWNEGSPKVTWASRCTYKGADLEVKTIPRFDNCMAACYSLVDCTHFAWASENGGTCMLKGGSGKWKEQDVLPVVNDTESICGFVKGKDGSVAWQVVGEIQFAKNCDFTNADFRSMAADEDKCAKTCMAEQECTHFTWTDVKGGTCWLKSKDGNWVDEAFRVEYTSICGFRLDRSKVV